MRQERDAVSLPLLVDASRAARAEWQHMAMDWDATSTPYPRDATLAQAFTAQAYATPDAIAVVSDDQQLSYAALLARASQLAHHLRGLGVGTDLPLDPTYPAARLQQMLDDAGAPLVLTQPHLHAPLVSANVPLLDMVDVWPRVSQMPMTPPDGKGQALDLAYLCYTSGSTGGPKGVAIPQRAVLRL